ncbi:hypothetical protein TG4357_02969 [Thalassovita gelatinovora]|uniref:Translocation and assembly module TamB C-terminal domain-containing protein n=1 Tax=Thalassovita gelatinovora TaxID=53501 RepID=A0A0P1FH51_THAGE|nr:translocation/assembly module TamB domain-containing protein [Thalassovita gelatinovora]QIZ81964.1 hypothetical protein HFZ77_16480 [Thalassovita gelatinovora]CUH67371.1 hypothetical protein TG4357_02969 [Thalassovita gelatinovora]SEP75354.1 autotransporter secretion inner membrane protein TamB [Thalassovita gelatinovora]
MRGYIFSLLLLAPLPALAQDAADDRGYLEALLEDNLSSPEAEVDITGFRGALSSNATIDRISIADVDGIWITLEDVSLIWSRTALLRGALEVDELTAGEIRFDRLPLPAETQIPSAEAPGFALPELPVSINLGKLAIEKAVLGQAIIGQELTLSLNGSAQLAAGEGSAELSVERLDVADSALELQASFANASRFLSIDLTLSEPKDGIVANLLTLPGAPAVDMKVAGAGPIEDFAADLTLATDGQPRLTGTASVKAVAQETTAETTDGADAPTDLAFRAEIGGDLAPIFAPEYRSFFGSDIRLNANGLRRADGAVQLDQLSLQANAIAFQGQARLSPEGWPDLLQFDGQIAAPQGGPVLLPLSGPETYIDDARFTLNFDAERDDSWRLTSRVAGLNSDDMQLNSARLTGNGRLLRGDGTSIGQVTGRFDISAEGIELSDPALAQAVGSDLRGGLGFDWSEDAPLQLSGIDLSGADYRAKGDLRLSGLTQGLNIVLTPDLQIEAANLSRFTGLAGRKLGGSAMLALKGDIQPLAGSVDVEIFGETQDLAVAEDRIDPLLSGDGKLSLRARRDENGSAVEALKIVTDHAEITGSATLKSDAGAVDMTARITDLARVVDGISGTGSATLRATRQSGDWQIEADANGPGGTQLSAQGSVAQDAARMTLDVTGNAPLALANRQIRPRQLSGQAGIDLRVDGAPSLAALSGAITINDARLALPDQRLALEAIQGAIRLSGANASIDFAANLSSGGSLTLTGPVSLTPGYSADLSARLTDLRITDPTLYETSVDGTVVLKGPLSGGAQVTGTVTLGETELRVPSTSGPRYANLPGLVHRNEPAEVRRVRSWAGLIETGNGGSTGPAYGLDLSILAPARIFVRGRGLDAELGGRLRLIGTTANVIPQGRFELIRGRLDILGKRLSLSEGLIQLQGAFDPYIRFVADTDASGTDVAITIDGPASSPDLSFSSSPELPQDEVLAYLLFGHGVTSISPLQAVRLAAAINTLSGRGGDGLTGNLRRGLALDDLDLTTSDDGTTEARAGKYISENIYSEVTADSAGNSEINLNLQINPALTARGTLSSDGDSGIGIFFEKDY